MKITSFLAFILSFLLTLAACQWSMPWNCYASRTLGWVNGKRSTQMMHRMIVGVTDPEMVVDHIDRNGLNNTRSNLRVCSRSENLWNSAPHRDGSIGLKGVFLNKRLGRYAAKIQANKKTIYLGSFETPELAHEAYRRAAISMHGEFARFN